MPYATKAQIATAREVPLLDFLQRYNPDDLVHEMGDSYHLKSHDSLKLSNGKWCWWSHGKMGGVNALEYLIKVEEMKFPEAVHLVNETCGFSHVSAKSPTKSQNSPAQSKARQPFLLPVHSYNNKRITAYLLSRGIDMEILDHCYQRGLIYEDEKYHNAVFVGYDNGTAKYATLRGATTGNRFMGEVKGSDKAYGFSVLGDGGDTILHVFECAIDALSYLTQVKLEGGNWKGETVLSLGGVYKDSDMIPIALQTYLNAHSSVQEVVLRLDNDDTGRNAAQNIALNLNITSVTILHPAQGKDYNEWLMKQKGVFSRQREQER